MINDDVLVILNEREPLKQQLAEELCSNLAERKWSAQRLTPSTHLAAIIRERSPKVVILDYLLGDSGTALDLLNELACVKQTAQYSVIIWTDEISITVAVEAMKLGALDFISTHTPRSLRNVIKAIETCLTSSHVALSRTTASRRSKNKGELVVHSDLAKESLSKIASAAKRVPEILVLLGPWGSGRSSMARKYHSFRSESGVFKEIHLDTWAGASLKFLERGTRYLSTFFSPPVSTLMLEHAEFDDGSLLEIFAGRELASLNRENSSSVSLIIGTSSESLASAWVQSTSAEVIELPSLEDRKDDLLPLLQLLDRESMTYGKERELAYSDAFLEALLALSWPGNIKELRSVMLEYFTTPQTSTTNKHSITNPSLLRGLSEHAATQINSIMELKLRWERFNKRHYTLPKPYAAMHALEACNGDFRAAAALLGTGVLQLRKSLQAPSSNTNQIRGAEQ